MNQVVFYREGIGLKELKKHDKFVDITTKSLLDAVTFDLSTDAIGSKYNQVGLIDTAVLRITLT